MDSLADLGIGAAGERGSIYGRWLGIIKSVQQKEGGLRKGWSEAARAQFRSTFDTFLSIYPWFAGYWIHYARCEFKLGNTKGAIDVYNRALVELPYAPDLWAAYLEFIVLVWHDTDSIDREFERAVAFVGDDFYAHVVYDVYLEYLTLRNFQDRKRELLLLILTKTLHQFAKYFAMIRDDGLMGKYYEQQERVAQAWKYECQLHRPTFFHPKPLKQQERAVWIHYLDSQIENEGFKHQLFRRLLICGALDESLWLRYIRWLIAKRQSPIPAFETADRQLPADLVQVRLYHALWLEHIGENPTAIYEKLGSRGAVQASQYASRTSGDPRSILESALESTSSPADKVNLLRELVKYDKNAFEAHPLPDNAEYWRAYLAARPDCGEDIYLRAPEGSITNEYLALLARTNVVKYVEVDRMVHRSALV